MRRLALPGKAGSLLGTRLLTVYFNQQLVTPVAAPVFRSNWSRLLLATSPSSGGALALTAVLPC